MDPCIFPDKENPLVPESVCKETFQTGVSKNAAPVLPDDPLAQVYFASLAGVGIYILYCLMEKSK
jgi:hypothetical protein